MTFVESHFNILKGSVGTATTATHSPPRSPRLAIDAHECDFSESFSCSAAQQVPRIVLFFAIGQFGQSTHLIQSRSRVVQSQAQCIQQRALARARGSADGKQAGRSQRIACEVDRMSAGERRDIVESDA